MSPMPALYYGDNLYVLRESIADESESLTVVASQSLASE